MNDQSNYNLRQYSLMLQMLDNYENKQLSLRKLIDGLEGLLGVLENTSEDWQQTFLKHWGILEDIYAIRVDEGRNELSAEEHSAIIQATADLKNLVLTAEKETKS